MSYCAIAKGHPFHGPHHDQEYGFPVDDVDHWVGMNWFTGLMVYVIVWWLIWFMMLPIGVKVPETVEKGHAPSAPSNPKLGIKFATTR